MNNPMSIVPLTLDMACELAANLGTLDSEEALRVYPDLEAWAQSRVDLPGAAWALMLDEQVIVAGGVVSKDADTGVLWLAGRDGWAWPHVIHAVRIWREVLSSGLYKRYECECAIGRRPAMQFAERMGLKRLYEKDGLVHYEVQT
jgi:hypothetical protein